MKKEDTGRKKIFATCTFNKGSCLEYRRNLCKSVRERKATQSKKWAKYLNRQIIKENIQMASGHMGTCSGSVDLKEMQVKVSMHYHLIPTRMAKRNRPENLTILSFVSIGKNVEQLERSCTAGGSLIWKPL